MKGRLFIGAMLLLGACVGEPPPCPGPEEKWIAVGFFSSSENFNRWDLPIDTSFSSVYPIGTNAELAGRRIENYFLLPIPHAGGQVSYVFQQHDLIDTLSLFITTSVSLSADDCGLLMNALEVEVLQERTTMKADIIQVSDYFPYDDPKTISSSLAVFVP